MYREEVYVRLRWPFRSAERWYAEYRRAWGVLENGPLNKVERAYDRRVLASWGLIARARAALPFALQMLSDANPEVRADATSVLDRLGGDPAAIAALVHVLESETELEPLDAAIEAVGRLKASEAIPALTRLIRDEQTDGDTRFGAALALGRIVGKRFAAARAIEDALAWLDRQEN